MKRSNWDSNVERGAEAGARASDVESWKRSIQECRDDEGAITEVLAATVGVATRSNLQTNCRQRTQLPADASILEKGFCESEETHGGLVQRWA